MPHETITVTADGPACIIHLNRPDRRNAVSLQMMAELVDVARTAESDPAVRSVIITGGDKFFSSGADLTEAVEVTGVEGCRDYFRNWHALTRTLEDLGKPVIAAIEGYCFTGGLELALACDLRVAGEGASFAITSSRIGTVAGAGGTQRLPRVVGTANAMDMLLSAEPIDTAEAHRIGLINRRTVKGGALDEALGMAAVHAERAPLSLGLVKKAVYRGMQVDLDTGLDLELAIVTTAYGTDDKQEGITAFLEKRAPKFTGR